MATRPKVRPPFAWLGEHTATVSLTSTLIIAAGFRFWRLDLLPPGLYSRSAEIGLQAAALIDKGIWPGLNSANGYAPLLVWLQATMVGLFGHTELALRFWPAALGVLAVLTTWLWARAWFGLRIAWLTAFFVAITPWAVTLSRLGIETAIWPFLVTFTLWLATRAWQQPNLARSSSLAVMLVINLLCGPGGWLLTMGVLIAGLILHARAHTLFVFNRARSLAVAILVAGGALAGWLAYASWHSLQSLPAFTAWPQNLGAGGSTIIKTLLMFNVAGDENIRHNLIGQPLLNAFVGLMLIAGLLVGITRLHQRRYRVLYGLGLLLLLPTLLTTAGAPNGARASLALPVMLALAAIGTSYMLDLWYRTFPVNSAARATGQAAILVLLGLSLFQGYTQYFNAWGNLAEIYPAHNESAWKIAHTILVDKSITRPSDGTRYVVVTPGERATVAYLVRGARPYTIIQAADIASLPIGPGLRKFVISTASHDEAVKNLKVKFAGGVLRPLYSEFNYNEAAYTYEVTTK